MEMIKRLFIKCDKSNVESVLRSIAEIVGGRYVIADREGSIYASIEKNGVNLINIRITDDISELILNTALVNVATILRILDLGNIAKVINRLKVLPSAIAIAKIMPSQSLHLILQGRVGGEVFPNIKVVVRKGYYEVSASYCRITKEENTCELLHELLKVVKELWTLLFEDTKG